MNGLPGPGEVGARREAPGPWQVAHALAAFAAGLLASLVAGLAVAPGGITSFETFAVVGPAQALGIFIVVAVLRWGPAQREPLGLRFAPADAWGLPAGAGLEVGLSLLLALLAGLFGGEAPVQDVVQVVDEATGLGTRAAVVASAVILAPLAEELVFRGILLRALTRRYGPAAAALGSAAAFSLVHLLDPNAALAVPALFVMGLVLAWVVSRTGRLGGAVTLHAGFNLLSVVLLLTM